MFDWSRGSVLKAMQQAKIPHALRGALEKGRHALDSPFFREAWWISSRTRLDGHSLGLNEDRLKRLLDLLLHLSPDQVELLASWSEQRTHWVLALRRYAQAFGSEVGCSKSEALSTVVGLIGSRFGCRLEPAQLARLERAAAGLKRDEIGVLFAGDAWVDNFLTSIWEYSTGAVELTSYPWNVSLPVADVCNARCVFCTSWLEGREVLKLEQVDALAEVIRRAVYLGLVGHGEPMAHPRFPELCDRLSSYLDSRACCYTITNGFFLEKWLDRLRRINLQSYSISLNAATAETHDEIMGLGPTAFGRIVDSIRELIRLRDRFIPSMHVYITMVVTRQNMQEIPRFIELGNELRVTGVWLRSLLPQADLTPGLNYHLLPPVEHPDFERLRDAAISAVRSSAVPVKADPASWGAQVLSPSVKQRIAKQPPPIVGREEALRDHNLRGRNQFLYDPVHRVLRGAPRDLEGFSNVEWHGGHLHVKTPTAQWSYAAVIPLTLPKGFSGRGRVEVNVEGVQGTVGFGLLGPDETKWIERSFMDSADPCVTALDFPQALSRLSLVIENAAPGGVPSVATVRDVRLLVEEPTGLQAVSDGVNWGGLSVRNGLDPLDDGLNPMNRQPRFACKAVYYCLYINEMYYRVNPCCYMQAVPGFDEIRFDGSYPFLEAWNAPAMVMLRTRLRQGPLFGACKHCPEDW